MTSPWKFADIKYNQYKAKYVDIVVYPEILLNYTAVDEGVEAQDEL
jgi:hypothetical protein